MRELWRTIKLIDEGCLISKVVGNKDMEVECYVVVDFNEANSDGNRGKY